MLELYSLLFVSLFRYSFTGISLLFMLDFFIVSLKNKIIKSFVIEIHFLFVDYRDIIDYFVIDI